MATHYRATTRGASYTLVCSVLLSGMVLVFAGAMLWLGLGAKLWLGAF